VDCLFLLGCSVAAIVSAASPSHSPSLARTPSSLGVGAGVEPPVQAQELHALRLALLHAANENTRLRARLYGKRFATLKPIPVSGVQVAWLRIKACIS